jgi:hypothetical protein
MCKRSHKHVQYFISPTLHPLWQWWQRCFSIIVYSWNYWLSILQRCSISKLELFWIFSPFIQARRWHIVKKLNISKYQNQSIELKLMNNNWKLQFLFQNWHLWKIILRKTIVNILHKISLNKYYVLLWAWTTQSQEGDKRKIPSPHLSSLISPQRDS